MVDICLDCEKIIKSGKERHKNCKVIKIDFRYLYMFNKILISKSSGKIEPLKYNDDEILKELIKRDVIKAKEIRDVYIVSEKDFDEAIGRLRLLNEVFKNRLKCKIEYDQKLYDEKILVDVDSTAEMILQIILKDFELIIDSLTTGEFCLQLLEKFYDYCKRENLLLNLIHQMIVS